MSFPWSKIRSEWLLCQWFIKAPLNTVTCACFFSFGRKEFVRDVRNKIMVQLKAWTLWLRLWSLRHLEERELFILSGERNAGNVSLFHFSSSHQVLYAFDYGFIERVEYLKWSVITSPHLYRLVFQDITCSLHLVTIMCLVCMKRGAH